ncbi:hypothetical protein NGM37_10800, partial [Streptomyces sp. TRM76130]|nr:hypothetical protein [Streptomyces sp. TRM76130]
SVRGAHRGRAGAAAGARASAAQAPVAVSAWRGAPPTLLPRLLGRIGLTSEGDATPVAPASGSRHRTDTESSVSARRTSGASG